MGNKPGQPLRGEDSRTQLHTAETLSATAVSQAQQQQQSNQQKQTQSKTGSSGSTGSTSSGNGNDSKQEVKKKNKLRKKRLPFLRKSQDQQQQPQQQATSVIQQPPTQSMTGSDPNQAPQGIPQSDYIKKEATAEELTPADAAAGGGGGKPKRKSKSGKKAAKNRHTTEDTVEKDGTIEKDTTVEKTTDGAATGGTTAAGGAARRKKKKLSATLSKDDNTEFERIKTKARPARQKKNSKLAGTKNLEKMMEQDKTTKEELSLKSFDEEDELVTARLEPIEQPPDTVSQTTTDTKTSVDADKSAKGQDNGKRATKHSDYL